MKIIKKPELIEQTCPICGTKVEITYKEMKRKNWKCPFCKTKNKVDFKVKKPTVKHTNTQNKKVKLPKFTKFNTYVFTHKPKIEIVDYDKYGVERLEKSAATKLFELVNNGYNSVFKLKNETGLAENSIKKYMLYLRKARLVNSYNGTFWVNKAVKIIKLED